MQTWSISYTTEHRKKLKNRNWLPGKMNYNPSTSLAHFYDENSTEFGKQKLGPDQIVPDAQINLWKYLIEILNLESVEEVCVEDVFDRLNKELGIEEFNKQTPHRSQTQTQKHQIQTQKQKHQIQINKVTKPAKQPLPSKIGSNELVQLHDILYTRDKGSNRVWHDGFLKFHPNLSLAEFYEGEAGKLVHKKVMESVGEGMVIEGACGGTLTIEICSIRDEGVTLEHGAVMSDKELHAQAKVHARTQAKVHARTQAESHARTQAKVHARTQTPTHSRVFSILYTTDKTKKSKKWLDGLLDYNPTTKLARFLEDETRVCFYKKIMPTESIVVGAEMSSGMYLVQIDHEICGGVKENIDGEVKNNGSVNAKVGSKVKSIVADEGVPLEGRSNDQLLALLKQNNKE